VRPDRKKKLTDAQNALAFVQPVWEDRNTVGVCYIFRGNTVAKNKTICYRAIQIIYRNAIVSHFRTTLVGSVADKSRQIVREVLGDIRWSEAQAIAEKAKASSGMTIKPADDFDLIGVEHVALFIGSYFLDLCPTPKGLDSTLWRSSKKQLLGWVDSIKEGRNVISHPHSEDLDFADSYRLLDTCRRTLEKLGLGKAASEVAELARELDGYVIAEELILESSLPNPERIVVGFVGREKELSALRDWFYDPRSRHWLLAGDGGKGKSALAYQFACEVREKGPPPYHLVAWLSAKKRQFDQGRSAILPLSFANNPSASRSPSMNAG
jgi:hypothetical protein